MSSYSQTGRSSTPTAHGVLVQVFGLVGMLLTLARPAWAVEAEHDFDELARTYDARVLPLLSEYCLDCHSHEAREGELDLERFAALQDVRSDASTWVKVEEFLENGEMPPENSLQPSGDERRQLLDWIDGYLDAEAAVNAGDPGPVVLRRLNNSEYTWTIRELTGVDLDPAREFPADGAAGEGFTNTGAALSMSPALVEKYLQSSREIAEHAVLLPDGIGFSVSTTRQDWANERIAAIRGLYRRHTSGNQDVSSLDRWSVTDTLSATESDGRLDLTPYISALVTHPGLWTESPDTVEAVAVETGLNLKYLRLLVAGLSDDDSALMTQLRERIRQSAPEDVSEIVADITRWQEQLWRFNVVGHYGAIRPWQEPATPILTTSEFRVPIGERSDEMMLYLTASSVPGWHGGTVEWRNARIERPGAATVPLRSLGPALVALERIRETALSATTEYLAAAFEVRTQNAGDIHELAAEHGIDPLMLQAWLRYLGLSIVGDVALGDRLEHRLNSIGGHDFVGGWGLAGVNDLSLLGNSSDQKVNIPGDMGAHRVAVHPRPERTVAAGWASPIDGDIHIETTVRDAHNACGNGVQWSLDLRRGASRRTLRSGVVELGAEAEIDQVESIPVRQGDVVALSIGPRDSHHACDLTEVDLVIREVAGPMRSWSLAGDCADSIHAGNPHPDRHGHVDTWHFFSEMIAETTEGSTIPEGSLLAAWLDATDKDEARRIAQQLAILLSDTEPEARPEDVELRDTLLAPGGPLFGQLDFAALAESATDENVENRAFGVQGASFDGDSNILISENPSTVAVRLPPDLFEGAEFAVSAVIRPDPDASSVAQFDVTFDVPRDVHQLQPGLPFVADPDSEAEKQLLSSLDDFRSLFPAAMCYARIVPVDEVVTLVLFHREDDHLARLMLSRNEQAQLDRLWDELHYVGQDALRIEVALEQILEFATQDSDPTKFDPLREPIAEAADSFRDRLLETRPAHVASVVDFARRAWRRPLSPEEESRIRDLYVALRDDDVSHEDTVRLMLARVLTAPAFLYKLEQPGPGTGSNPVSDWEMASRLSYFLWASPPDDELRHAATEGALSAPEDIRRQAQRMLGDNRVRRLAIEFASQWLHLRDFEDQVEKNERLYPRFAELRPDMYEETVQFFTNLFRNDGSVLDILDADHAFLNEELAAHYGVPDISGTDWRKVDGVRAYHRGGILTQATFLASQSGASRTSPILRGNWISETLLGERLPRPPKDVPVLPETVPDGLTERELIEQHSSVQECAKCHARIDPYGFALEQFDAIGRYREDIAGDAVDVRTTLVDGTELNGVDDLRAYLLTTRREDFLRQFCRKLLGYALGRSIQLSDQLLLDEMIVRLAENDHRISVAVDSIVASPQFRMIRGQEHE